MQNNLSQYKEFSYPLCYDLSFGCVNMDCVENTLRELANEWRAQRTTKEKVQLQCALFTEDAQ